MNCLVKRALLGGIVCFAAIAAFPNSHSSAFGTDQEVLEADHALTRILGLGDKASRQDHHTLDELLDEDFAWIDSNGKGLIKPEVLKNFPALANPDVELQEHTYGRSAVVRANRGRVQVMRVRAKRASGWRVMLYQQVTLVVKSEPPVADGAGISDCENPCKDIPFPPETQSEKEVIASWQGVMSAMAHKDADAYAPLIAEEFTATDTHHDRAYSKADRIVQINKQKQSGVQSVPPPLVSARMFDFGETVMMIAREQRPSAKAYFNTRMWVKRHGRWQMLFSFNTRIE
jgi:hypothetical protein